MPSIFDTEDPEGHVEKVVSLFLPIPSLLQWSFACTGPVGEHEHRMRELPLPIYRDPAIVGGVGEKCIRRNCRTHHGYIWPRFSGLDTEGADIYRSMMTAGQTLAIWGCSGTSRLQVNEENLSVTYT